MLTIAFQNLGLQEHGVVDWAVVTGKSPVTSDSNGDGQPYYMYSLRALSGSAVPGDLGDPYGMLSIGEHVTVLADPDFLTLDTRVSASGQLLAGDGIAGAAAVLLAVAAWTWTPRPERAQALVRPPVPRDRPGTSAPRPRRAYPPDEEPDGRLEVTLANRLYRNPGNARGASLGYFGYSPSCPDEGPPRSSGQYRTGTSACRGSSVAA